MITKNKMAVIGNIYQGKTRRVLCVCSGGVLRSPTAAWLLSKQPFSFNTRSCGDQEYALIPLTEELVVWADEIVVMDEYHQQSVMKILTKNVGEDQAWPLIHVLGIPDNYEFKDPELIEIMKSRFTEIFT